MRLVTDSSDWPLLQLMQLKEKVLFMAFFFLYT